MLAEELEVIAVLDAVDELTSASFQVRWSYLPSELRWGHAFVDMVRRDHRRRLAIDAAAISATYPLAGDTCAPTTPLK